MPTPCLLEIFATLPDPRSRHGRRHPLPAVLGLVVFALLLGRKSLEAIAQLGRDAGPPLAHALGFRCGQTPAKSTLSRLLRALDVAALTDDLLRAGGPDIYRRVSNEVDRVILERVLRHVNGNQLKASELLGISRTTLRAKLRTLGITIDKLSPTESEGPE